MVSVMTTACINNLAIQELNNKAASYLDKGDTETAICRLKSSLDLDNEIYQTHYNLAIAYNSIENYEGAISEANRVLELKPELFDSYYIIAVAQESIAYKILEESQLQKPEPSVLAAFIAKAQEAIDSYNKYLVNVPNAVESDKINSKIEELNAKIKEFSNDNVEQSVNQDETETVQ